MLVFREGVLRVVHDAVVVIWDPVVVGVLWLRFFEVGLCTFILDIEFRDDTIYRSMYPPSRTVYGTLRVQVRLTLVWFFYDLGANKQKHYK